MPRKLTIITYVDKHGCLPRSRQDEIETHLTLYAGGKVKITIERPMRSVSQNAFYHGFVLRPIREAILSAGLSPVSHEALHAYFRDRYLDPTIEDVFGAEKVLRPSTASLSSTDFHYYVESVKHDEIVRQLGVRFPEPDESYSFDDLPA